MESTTTLVVMWILYVALTVPVAYYAKHRLPFAAHFFIAACISTLDLAIPFTFSCPRDIIPVVLFQLMICLVRPPKIMLAVFNKGPLAQRATFTQYAALATLPVMPVACLSDNAQRRTRKYTFSALRGCGLIGWLILTILANMLICLTPNEGISYTWRAARHLLPFYCFAMCLFDACAALATGLGVGPLSEPWNNIWVSRSPAEFWSFRWNTVVSSSLRMCAYQPIIEYARSRSTVVPKYYTAVAVSATFALSAILHEYVMFAHNYWHAFGPLTVFFMMQPVLSALHSGIVARCTRMMARCTTEFSTNTLNRALEHMLTVALLLSAGLLFWVPAYEPPFSTMTQDVGEGVMRLARLCRHLPYCTLM